MRICTPRSAMAHTMVMASAVDAEMTDSELLRIGQQINCIPLFGEYEPDKPATDAAAITAASTQRSTKQRQPCPPACARRPMRSPAKLSLRTDIEHQLSGYCVTTAEIIYLPPDHLDLLQT